MISEKKEQQINKNAIRIIEARAAVNKLKSSLRAILLLVFPFVVSYLI